VIDVKILRAMAAAGAGQDAILAAVEAAQAMEEEKRASKREKAKLRKQAQRDRERHASSRDVTLVTRDNGDVTVTACDKKERSPTPPKEKTTPYEVSNETSPGVGPAKRRVGARIADDWQPSDDGIAFAEGRGLRGQDLRDEIAKFKNHFGSKTGKDAVKLDWQATWRNWILNWVSYRGRNGNRTGNAAKPGNGAFLAGLVSLADVHPGDGQVARAAGEEIPPGRHNIDG
jgi:hypothetical protein